MAKYIVGRTDGTPIPEDEPCFVIRAQDQMATAIVTEYLNMARRRAMPEDFLDQIRAHRDRIIQWQQDNPTRVKRPD